MKPIPLLTSVAILALAFPACTSVQEGPRRDVRYSSTAPAPSATVQVEYPAPSSIPQRAGSRPTTYVSNPSAYDAPGNTQPSPYGGGTSGSNLTHDRPDQSPYSR